VSRAERLAGEVTDLARRVASESLTGQAVTDLLGSPDAKSNFPELLRRLSARSITIPVVVGLVYIELAKTGQLPTPKGKSMPTMHRPTKATATKATAKKATAKKAAAKKAPAKAATKKAPAKKAATPRNKIEVFDPEGKTTHVCITCGERKPISRFYQRPTGMRNAFCRICGKLARGVITPAEAKARREREAGGAAKKAPPTQAAARRKLATRKAAPARRRATR
jgi:hypothetical protein